MQDAQELGLQFERKLADFVEKDGAAVCGLEESLLRLQCAGKRSLFVAEEFAFDERRDERSAIDGNKRTIRKCSAEVHGAGDKFFSGSALAVDQDRRTRVFQPRDHAQDFLNTCRRSDDAVNSGFRIGALPQEFVFFDQADLFRHAAQEQAQFFERRKWLRDVVVSAQFHGLDGSLDRAVAGHQRDFSARKKLLYFFQKFEARHVWHDHVAEHHVHRLLFEQCQCGIAAFGLETDESQRFADGRANLRMLCSSSTISSGCAGLLC